jgi:hypothetical protein
MESDKLRYSSGSVQCAIIRSPGKVHGQRYTFGDELFSLDDKVTAVRRTCRGKREEKYAFISEV